MKSGKDKQNDMETLDYLKQHRTKIMKKEKQNLEERNLTFIIMAFP
jgi:hypothetical protein